MQVHRVKRQLDFGQEKQPKHVLAKHERKDPLVFGFVTRHVRRNVRGEFEIAVGQTQYLAENKGNPRMLRCGKRYRLLRKDYEEAETKLKAELMSLNVKLEEAEKSQSRHGKHCKFSEEELVTLKSQYDRLFVKERKAKAKANLRAYRSAGVRASKRILWKIRPKRNRFADKPRLKLYLLWQLLRQRCERVTSQVEEAEQSLKLAKVVNKREQRRRLQHAADVQLKNRMRWKKWCVNHHNERLEQKKRYRETMKSVLNRDRRLKYKSTMLLGRKLSCGDRRRRNAVTRKIRHALLVRFTENVRLQELSGQLGVLQSGTRVEREEKQREWRSTVVDNIMRRTGEKPWKNCRSEYKQRQREKLRAKVESDIDHVLGVKNMLVRHFTKHYHKILGQVTEWTEKVESSIEECTYDSVIRPDESKIHVRSEKEILLVPKDLEFDEDGRAPCTEECVLPAKWAERLVNKLECLTPWENGIVECLESFMKLQLCDGCVVNHYCTYGIDGCEDVIRLMLAVRPHSVMIRTFLRNVYRVSRLVKKLVDVDTVLLEGTSCDLTDLLKRIGQKQSEEEDRQQLVSLGFLPGPPTSAEILKEKWGDLVERFHDIEKDHPDTVCFFCQRMLRMTQIQMRVKKLESVRNKDSQENFAQSLLDMLDKDEWDDEIDALLEDEECPFHVCKTCWTYVRKREVGGPMLQNEMEVDDVPEELSTLNTFELFLVCRANPFYSVIQLKTYSKERNARTFGLVKGIKGNAAHLRLSTAETASHVLEKMPMTNVEDQLRIYAMSIPNKEKTLWKNLVDMDKVLLALEWLKANNPLYEDIVIDKNAAEKIDSSKFVRMTCDDNPAAVDRNLEREDEEVPQLKRMLTETLIPEMESEYVMQATEEANVTAGEHIKAFQQVKVEGKPMNFGTMKELDMMSLPILYPRGRGGVSVKRDKAKRKRFVRPREYFRYRLQHKSGRYRRMQKFLHVGAFLKRERAVGQGTWAATNTGSNLSQMKAAEIVTAMKHKDVEVERDLTTAFQAMKGTQEYWSRVKGDVQAMDESLGPATFFMTLSCAEFHWGELERYLRKVNADLDGVRTMTLQQLLVKDPVSVSEFFMRRFKAFLDEVILAKVDGQPTEGPLGLVEHFFWRLEYQARGAPHIHMKLWVKDAPVVGVNANEEVLRFIAKYIRADLPKEEENRELYNTVVAYQVHKCTGSCMRYVAQKKGRGFKRCRYGYPMPPCDNYELNDFEESVKSHTNKRKRVKKLYNLPRGESEVDRSVNPYNPLVLSAWKANMDIQFLGEESRVLNAYITGYITKGEKNNTESIWESLNADKSVKSRIMSLIYERFRNREVGAYEMADDLLGHSLHGSSRSVVFVGVGLPEKRSRKLKPYEILKKLPANSRETKEDNVVETYYPTRHKDLKDICLYDIVKLYNFKRKEADEKGEKETADVLSDAEDEMNEEEGRSKPRKYWCTPDVGYFVLRKKPVIPKTRYVPCVAEKAEAFFQSLLQQFVPYVNEKELKRGQDTYQEAFDEWILQPGLQQLTDAKKRKDTVQKAVELRKRLEEEATAEEAQDEQANAECPDYEDEVSPIDSTGFRTVEDYMTDEGLEKRVRSLNSEQTNIYEEILGEVRKQVDGDAGAKQILKFVSGGAGVGKSKLIETLTEGVEKLTSQRAVLAAPTGMAAQNIQGRTAHAVFRLPAQKRDCWAYQKLDPSRMKEMYAEIGKSKLIVIDEVSLVANRMLMFIHLRLQEMTGCKADVPFGGCNVIVLGDLLQLPPVGMKGMKAPYVFHQISGKEIKDAFPGSVFNRYPMNLWRQFSYGELTENMRQQDDRSYAEMLNELRVGKLTEATKTCLRNRVANVEKTVEGHASYLIKLRKEGKKPLCIMAKKKQVQSMNLAVMSKENIKPVLLHANDRSLGRRKKKLPIKNKLQVDEQVDWPKVCAYVKENSSRDDNKTGGLADIVILGEGARVMLRRNLDVSRGLYNGAQGVVRKVIYNNKMPDGVSALMVEFDGVPGGPVRVERAVASWFKGRSIEVKREQFPLCLCYAITIHKSQGLSLDCVVSDLGEDIFTTGMAYVVLSRVRKLEGLHLLNFDEKSVMCDTNAVKEYNRLRKEYTDLPMLEELKGKEAETVLKRSLNLAMFNVEDDDCESRNGKRSHNKKADQPMKNIVRKMMVVVPLDDQDRDVGFADPPQLNEAVRVETRRKIVRKKMVVAQLDDQDVDVGFADPPQLKEAVRVETQRKIVRKKMVVVPLDHQDRDVGFAEPPQLKEAVPVDVVTMRVKVNSDSTAVEKTKRRFSKAMKDDCQENVPVLTSKRSCERGSDVDGHFVPLRNPGVHCFGNASVQALLSCSSGLAAWVNGTTSTDVAETEASLAMRKLLKPFFDAKKNGMGRKEHMEVVKLLKWLCDNRRNVEVNFLDGEHHDSHEFLLKLFEQSESLGRLFLMRRKVKVICQSCFLETQYDDEFTTEWALRLNEAHGDKVDFEEFVRSNSIDELEKRCEQCEDMDKVHLKHTSMEMLDDSKYVVMKIERFIAECHNIVLPNGKVGIVTTKREVKGAITGFNADDVSILGDKLKVCAAVVYESSTGEKGHYYTYVRSHGKDRWLKCDDKTCTGKAKFVPNLKKIMYMILEKQ
jgi:ubiquitin C-terminal hydrolase